MAISAVIGLAAVALLLSVAGSSSAFPIRATKIRIPLGTSGSVYSYKVGQPPAPLCTDRTSVEALSDTEYYDNLLTVFLELVNRSEHLQAQATEYFDAEEVRETHRHTHTQRERAGDRREKEIQLSHWEG